MPSSARFSTGSAPPAAYEGALELPRLPGRLRTIRDVLVLIPALIAAWIWFGLSGTLPLLIWWWHLRPRPSHPAWHVELDRVRAARLGPWRTCLTIRGEPPLEIFHDEILPGDLARLRRTLKAQLAAGCSTSNRSE